MKTFWIFVFLIAIFFDGHPSEAQAPFLVYVSIPKKDDPVEEITATLLKSYVERGLREWGDHVKIIDHLGSSYQLRILFLEHKTNNGVRTGDMSISYVLTKIGRCGCDCYVASYILLWNRSNLREAADLIVANIDEAINL